MIISQTPLRISFLGGNTDFPQFYEKYGGCVLTTAINKYIYCIVTKRFDNKIYVNWSKKEIVDNVSQIEHELVKEALIKTKINKGIEITFLSDIPAEGSGLGSSSSVTVGLLNALYHYLGEKPSSEKLAAQACEIEIEILRKPIGVQDQYIAAYGGLRFFTFDRQITSEKIDLEDGLLDDLNNNLMMFYTGRTRKSGQILTMVKDKMSTNNKKLLETKKLALEGYRKLNQGNVLAIGKLMHKHWLIKKSLAQNISDSEIDRLYAKALKAGAVGGKIAGAGGGGFLLLMVPYHARANVRKVLSGLREMPFRIEPEGSKIIFNYRNN
jgi:D-glycero-alpha-D-manno-heptose-7-phosphate kinase